MGRGESEERVVRTTCWNAPGCHGGCGVKLTIKDGKVTYVEGDEDSPVNLGTCCPRILALKQYMYHPKRVLHPMKRAGQRGEGKWERITWDEAYDTIERKLKEIRDKYGAESVLFSQGTGRDIGGPLTLLAYSYGSPNWIQMGLSGQSCYAPRLIGMTSVQGDYCVADFSQFLEKRFDDPQWKNPECVIVWGQNPAGTAGQVDALNPLWIVECMKRGTKLITVDPRVTWTAGRSEIHLQSRPGTDAALALGMMNVIINEGLYDKEFVEKWTYGFDELKKRVQEYPVEKVAEITWLDKDDIIKAARLFARSKPASIHWGVSIDHNPEGAVVAQAINQLWAITGNIDIPGGMVIARPSHGVTAYPLTSDALYDTFGEEFLKEMWKKRIGWEVSHIIRSWRAWVQPDMALEQIFTGKPYPIKGLFAWTCNIIGSQAADAGRHYEAFKKLDFVVVIDTFLNATSQAVGDIFLPAACFPERDHLRAWWTPLSVGHKIVQVGECKGDWEIALDLAKRVGQKPIKANNVRELFNERMKKSGLTFEQLVEKGCWEMAPEGPTKPYHRHERGLLRKDGKPGFNTATGKVELWSKWFDESNLDPLPYYEEPPEGPISTPEMWKEYPLILNTGRRTPVYFHSEHRQLPWLRQLEPDPTVEIHPDTAKPLGIKTGDWVYIENKKGRIKSRAKVTPTILPQVICAAHGWWLIETEGKEPNLYGLRDYNVNMITEMGHQGRCGFGGAAYRYLLCRIYKVEEGGK